MRKVTIEDISRHTGLSRGTISRAINDRPDIAQATRQRVLEACRKLNYVPSHAARSLATGRTQAVAVLTDELGCGTGPQVLRGIVEAALRVGYMVHVIELGAGSAAAEQLRRFSAGRVDAFLLAGRLDPALVPALLEVAEQRAVVSCVPIPQRPGDVLAPDHCESGRLAARFMLEHVGGDVLYVHADRGECAAQRRLGFEEVCRTRGLDPAAITLEVPADRSGAAGQIPALCERLARVSAVVAGDDFLAVELMLACERLGRTPGRDVAILGQGNEPLGERIRPALSTVDPGGMEIGRRMMEMAIQRLEQARMDAPQTVLVAPALVERESTRGLPTRRRASA